MSVRWLVDGFDIDSTQDLLLENSHVASGDDTIAMKSGIDYYGRLYNRSTKNILVRNITVAYGGGLTIGSETSGGVQNVTCTYACIRSCHRFHRCSHADGADGADGACFCFFCSRAQSRTSRY